MIRWIAVGLVLGVCLGSTGAALAQLSSLVLLDKPAAAGDFPVAGSGGAAAIYVAPGNPETVRVAAEAFASDVEKVTAAKPRMLSSLKGTLPAELILVGVLGSSPEIDALRAAGKIDTTAVAGKWESAVTAIVANPLPGVKRALVIAGSDRRGAAYALFALSRQMGVSPWTWWADVPVVRHASVAVRAGTHVQGEPSVQYRGIFFNDEDWGLRPWAAKTMDPKVDGGKGNVGPRTYERVFELLLRLHSNSLWPAMHPGSLAFNAVAENARLADRWGIVMGSSHSEALLRNNVGEWDEKRDGPWNYQVNAPAMDKYWDKRLAENGRYENFYTVGLRGVHDSGLEATGTPEVKAKLVEDVMASQRRLLAARVNPEVAKIPQVIWVYKESLDLYRVGMQVPPDVTLGWTDDNYGYIRELPNAAEQALPGGSGIYYHVSYWGSPHDYLWLCTTPPALIREEMTKAYDHNARRYWVLNVGDLKPAEMDIDYFMQLATDEPAMAQVSQRDFLKGWAAEQFPAADAAAIAEVMTRYYALNFVRKPEFMGFNGYNDGVNRTAFNPLAWGGGNHTGQPDQNHARFAEWSLLRSDELAIAKTIPPAAHDAFFELIAYPIEAAAAQNAKFLYTDLTYLDASRHEDEALQADTKRARAAYEIVQTLTAQYNSIENGKWSGMMSASPRERHVFEMPVTATSADAGKPLPASWGVGVAAAPPIGPGFVEEAATVSINAAHFARSHDAQTAATPRPHWTVLEDLGISGASVVYGSPGLLAYQGVAQATSGPQDVPWLEYDFTTITNGAATLTLHLLPTFAVDSDHHLRYGVSIDGHPALELDASGANGRGPATSVWNGNVLRNSATASIQLAGLTAGRHTLRLMYRDPGVVFEHLVLTFSGAAPAYPVPPETGSAEEKGTSGIESAGKVDQPPIQP